MPSRYLPEYEYEPGGILPPPRGHKFSEPTLRMPPLFVDALRNGTDRPAEVTGLRAPEMSNGLSFKCNGPIPGHSMQTSVAVADKSFWSQYCRGVIMLE